MLIPNKVNHKFTEIVRILAQVWEPQFQELFIQKHPERTWKSPHYFGVTQTRGRAYQDQGEFTITIPDWLLKHPRAEEYMQEYVIHELTHVFDYQSRKTSDHGPKFWETFTVICPTEWWHFEETYKPREFKRAGMHLLDIFSPGKRPQDLTEDDI